MNETVWAVGAVADTHLTTGVSIARWWCWPHCLTGVPLLLRRSLLFDSLVRGIKQAWNRPVDLHELALVVPALDASLVLVFGGIVDDAGGQVPLDALRLGLRSRRRRCR